MRSSGAIGNSYQGLAGVLALAGIDNDNKGMTDGRGGRSQCGYSQMYPSLRTEEGERRAVE